MNERVEPTRPVPVEYKADGSVEGMTFLTPSDFKIRGLIEVPPMRVIPVIFVPGIMGSNLCKIGQPRSKVWRPPNGIPEGIGAARRGAFADAKERQLAFLPDEAEVDPSGPVMVPDELSWLTQYNARSLRGWGTVHADSYGSLLTYLEYNLNRIFLSKKLNVEWAAVLREQNAKHWGAQKTPFDLLAEEELVQLSRARFPVYAAGYNWLQSNEVSAQYLAQRIDQVLAQWPSPHQCSHVLIVTHSMGGLVARRCSQLVPKKILGVIHGVMPVLGAAATYKRMRSGFEGKASPILGWNEAEATASIANAPGPLELLPQSSYNGGKPWLRLEAGDKATGIVYKMQWLPEKDPYVDIYEKDAKACWYGLVNSELIDPAKLCVGTGRVAWDQYLENLHAARKFHAALGNYYHALTRVYYGADDNQLAWGNACWRTNDFSRDVVPDLTQGISPSSDGSGIVSAVINKVKASFKLSQPDARGDGTVPADASGSAPSSSPHVQQCYCLAGFDHQFSYNNTHVRWVLLHSLAKLAQKSHLVVSLPLKRGATVQ